MDGVEKGRSDRGARRVAGGLPKQGIERERLELAGERENETGQGGQGRASGREGESGTRPEAVATDAGGGATGDTRPSEEWPAQARYPRIEIDATGIILTCIPIPQTG